MLRISAFVSPLVALLLAAPALAVHPDEWVHRSEADFLEGTRQGLVVTNLGELRLAQQTHRLAAANNDDAIVYDIAQLDDGRVFVSLGPEGRLAELADEQLQVVQEYNGEQVFSLTADGNDLWVGVSAGESRLELRNGEEMEIARTIALPETRYVWDVQMANDRAYVATGTEGRLLSLNPAEEEPEPQVALEAGPSNILTLTADSEGRLYAGTDGEGLVYRVTRENGEYEPFILYDANEPEIGALLVLDDGTVYAGTADADQARPGRMEAARDEARGRGEGAAPEPVDGEAPDLPDDPAPGPPDDAPPEDPPADEAAQDPEADLDEPAEPEAEDAEAAAPTPEQYDQLRGEVRDRISEARASGRVPTQSAPSPRAASAGAGSGAGAGRSGPGGSGSRNGNAIYRISPDGFVHEVFRESVMILNLLEQNGGLLVTTGNEGQIYRVDPASEEVTILADLDAQQIPAVFQTENGDVLLGTANPGEVFELGSGFIDSGSLTSQPLDADQVSLWGKAHIQAETFVGATVEIRTRSGNVSDPELGTWSQWSQPQLLEGEGGTSDYLDVESPSARYLQYRLTIRANDEGRSPTVHEVSLRYLMPNLPPRISSLTAEYEEAPRRTARNNNPNDAAEPRHELEVEWEADDPNDDRLVYKIEARPFGTDDPFVTIADGIDEASYDWDTRTVPDGRYVLRLTASDAPDNIPGQAMTATRRSDPVTVDNTPPDVHDFDIEVQDNGDVVFTARVTDELSPITNLRYRVSGQDDWKMTLPEDLIYDSTQESFRVRISDLAPGRRTLTLRVSDAQGNTRHVSQSFTVPR